MTTKNRDAIAFFEKRLGRLTVAKFIRAWRLSDEMSQTEYAKFLGISVQSLCDLEKGRRIPSPGRAAKIAKKIGYPEEALISLALRDSLYADGLKYNVKLESI